MRKPWEIFRFVRMPAVALFGIVFLWAGGGAVRAQVADPVGAGTSWLLSARYGTGLWAFDGPPDPLQTEFTADDYTRTYVRDTLEALYTLQVLGTDPAEYADTLDWVEMSVFPTTRDLSLQAVTLAGSGRDPSQATAELNGRVRPDGSVGVAAGYPGGVLGTASALSALSSVGGADPVVSAAAAWLVSVQNPDGSWGVRPGGPGKTLVTARVVDALRRAPGTLPVSSALGLATDFLLSRRRTDGGFGDAGSTVYETALSYLALAGRITDETVLGGAREFLLSAQAADGSWNGDPWETALALRALDRSGDPAPPPPPPTTGTVRGEVVDASTGLPLAGAGVRLSGDPLVGTTTDATGGFTLPGVPEGPADIEFSLPGYSSGSYRLTVTAGSIHDLGRLALSPVATTGTIAGTVTDADTALPLQGVLIEVAGAHTGSAPTLADGTFSIDNVTPGDVSLSASLDGYSAVTGAGTVTAGGTLVFSPRMTRLPPPAPGSVTGLVVDGAGAAPVAGASVALASDPAVSTATDASGRFTLNGIAAGDQAVRVSAAGYGEASVVFSVSGGVLDLGTIPLSLNPTAGRIRGVVRDAASGTPLSGVDVSVAGAFTAATLTDASGAFEFADVTPGDVTVSAATPGYQGGSGTGTVTAGGVLVTNIDLVPANGVLVGTVRDADSGGPVAGATIAVSSGDTASSDAAGAFSLADMAPGSVEVTVSAPGYSAQTLQAVISPGGTTDLGAVALSPVPTSTTVSGVVTDAESGAPVPGAAVSVVGTAFSAVSGADGSYAISGVDRLEFDLRCSAAGFNSRGFRVLMSAHGATTVDFALPPSRMSGLRVTSVLPDRTDYGVNEEVTVTATIENRGTAVEEGAALLSVEDPAGAVVAVVPAETAAVSLGAGLSETKTFRWNTGQYAPGVYAFRVRVVYPASTSGLDPEPQVLAEAGATATLLPGAQLSGAISLDPPVTQADLQEPIHITAAVRNSGNVPLTTDLGLEVTHLGAPVYSASGALTDLRPNGVVEFDFGSFLPGSGGHYSVTLRPSDPAVRGEPGALLYVGDHARAVFTATPVRSVPGDVRLTAAVSLSGVTAATGPVQDPLVPIIREAIARGVAWEQREAVAWQGRSACNGCHVQTQTIIGAELSRDKVPVDDGVTTYLLDSLLARQEADGRIRRSISSHWEPYPLESTVLFAWALSYHHDGEKVRAALAKAVDYLLGRRDPSGFWRSDYYYGVQDWWNDFGPFAASTPFTAYTVVSLARTYALTGSTTYLDAALESMQYLLGVEYAHSIITAAHVVMGLEGGLHLVADPVLAASVTERIREITAWLGAAQNPDGGWPRYVNEGSDPLPTAHAVYALTRAGVPGGDPVLRAGVGFLLDSQNPDGTWSSVFVRQPTYPDQYFNPTTWAVISLPVALEVIGGLDVGLSVTFSPDTIVHSTSVEPNRIDLSSTGITYTWDFRGVNEKARDCLIDLTLPDLALNEARPVALDARIRYADTYSGETMSREIAVPLVHGFSGLALTARTDRAAYGAAETLTMDVGVSNLSAAGRSLQLSLRIEDESGHVAALLPETALALGPVPSAPFLEGWRGRIPIVIDPARIPEDLTDFPLRLRLGSAAGLSRRDLSTLFREVGTNARKIAVTTADGLTECFVEVENWDTAAGRADLWVRVPFLSATEETRLFLYYDGGVPDNTAHVGFVGEPAAQAVWDSHYVAVYHMEETSGAVLDSTANALHGTPVNLPERTNASLAGNAYHFSGADFIDLPDVEAFKPSYVTVESFVKVEAGNADWARIFDRYAHGAGTGYALVVSAGGQFMFHPRVQGRIATDAFSLFVTEGDGTWHWVSAEHAPGRTLLYADGVLNDVEITPEGGMVHLAVQTPRIGDGVYDPPFRGYIGELRVSDTARSGSWHEVTWRSLQDGLLVFGPPETTDVNSLPSAVQRTVLWNTGDTLAGRYLVHATLLEGGVTLNEATVPFEILPDRSVNAAVATDRIDYAANEPVALTSTISSASVNAYFEDLTATVTVRDGAGTALHRESRPIRTLGPGGRVAFNTYWNTGTNPPGDYPVSLVVSALGGSVIAADTTTLTISNETDIRRQLSGTLTLDTRSILTGEPVTIDYTVTNAGNVDLPLVDLSVLVVPVNDTVSLATLPDSAALAMGESRTAARALDTTGYSARDYLVVLRAAVDGREETLAGSYFRVEGAPSAPSLYWPGHGDHVPVFRPRLTVNNAADPNDDRLRYEFELYEDTALTIPAASSGLVAEGPSGTTDWTPPFDLAENAVYAWRVRAFDGLLYGPWMTPAAFRVNTVNDPPTAPTLSAPSEGSDVPSFTPTLVVGNAFDPDSTDLTYNFDIGTDPAFTDIVASEIGMAEGPGATSWTVPVALRENTVYYWRAQADDWLDAGPWMPTASFRVNTANDAPSAPAVTVPADGSTVALPDPVITASGAIDPEGDPLSYGFELDTTPTFDSPDLLQSVPIAETGGTASWPVAGLSDNTVYYVRAMASDGAADSPWSAVGSFFVNTGNDAPTAPQLANPSDGAGVKEFQPVLSVRNAADPDGDPLAYDFELYADAGLTTLLASATALPEGPSVTSWSTPVALAENSRYYWRARAFDGELHGPWMPAASFMINTVNDAPSAPALLAPADGAGVETLRPVLSVLNAADPDSDLLSYDFELYRAGALVEARTGVAEDPSGVTSIRPAADLVDGAAYTWRARAFDGERYGAWMDTAAFTVYLPVSSITATIDFDPDTLNRDSHGKWVTVYIELPEPYDVREIDVSSIRLEGVLQPRPKPVKVKDGDHDGIPDLKVKFSRADVIALLPVGKKVPVTVTGLVGAVGFEGVDRIRVKASHDEPDDEDDHHGRKKCRDDHHMERDHEKRSHHDEHDD